MEYFGRMRAHQIPTGKFRRVEDQLRQFHCILCLTRGRQAYPYVYCFLENKEDGSNKCIAKDQGSSIKSLKLEKVANVRLPNAS